MTEIRLTRTLYNAIRQDIARSHSFASERIGFAFGKLGNRQSDRPLLLLHRYLAVPDDRYIDDPKVGARIDGEMITEVMQQVMNCRAQREGVFHVHVHEHLGRPMLSRTDQNEIPLLIPSFQSVGRDAAHGLIVFSKDHGTARIWLPGEREPSNASRIVIAGVPLSIFEDQNHE